MSKHLIILASFFLATACQPTAPAPSATLSPSPSFTPTLTPTLTATLTPTPTFTSSPSPTAYPRPETGLVIACDRLCELGILTGWGKHILTIENRSALDLFVAFVYNEALDKRTGIDLDYLLGEVAYSWYLRAGESVEEYPIWGGEYLVYFTAGRDWLEIPAWVEDPAGSGGSIPNPEYTKGITGSFATAATYGRLTEPVRFDCFLIRDDREFSRCEREILLTFDATGAAGSEPISPDEFP